ncbi:hypothetical protein EN804_33795 [Mesorhizobium sp. M8A.F.Ca.ET.161.01.1.1]|nr:hypothetical protein EN845_33440 [Mesorhizobium sp. M8A.F.Ca.ET.202.01.1.1]TGR17606.1 hypothetical protein EN840_33710 [Mesorhizobium sp. M8A.F.Ca.ET.197.01.1.1]TGR36503.1 hypothetical protein EN842_54315 [bacterium M00.F.Ca.ET.199.01.1.1]TGR39672.1 hypothetical protein EN841_33705 [Mesorhizobium sp. M8A.F.Ca.ET.198.01.1.1]TGT81340.1 hypothetical protein EN804_33795 [Mesorhizobium sp. M8A.F.Ca.ET.161.01.1.1]TGU16623.1 hypothetical protein EN799_64920 [bacterium M00.F.Ca.ET.156.01.1.1]TGV34
MAPRSCRAAPQGENGPATSRSFTHPSSVSALRADPPSPTRGEGRTALAFRRRRAKLAATQGASS